MIELGYALSTEEHAPVDLVRFARRAEEVGFTFALISDHYHPWIDRQGQAPFAWSVIGAISQVTERLRLGTGVTCPTVRYHPALVAQFAATCASLMPGRFFLGLGSGEALNEHIYGDHWPPANIRLEMLEEAVEIINLLWEGEETSYWGEYYTVENACVYTLPDEPIPLYLAASGLEAAELAGETADGLISTAPNPKLVETFKESGGEGKATIGQVTVCWAEDRDTALNTAYSIWPVALVPGTLHADLPTPAHFEDAVQMSRKEDMAKEVVLGSSVDEHLQKIQEMIDAGFEQIYVHQIGPDQEGFFNFYQKEILHRFQ